MEKLSALLKKVKVYYQHILATVLIILLIVLVYWRDMEIIANEALNAEVLSHVILIPFFVGFLLYRKKASFQCFAYFRYFAEKGKNQVCG